MRTSYIKIDKISYIDIWNLICYGLLNPILVGVFSILGVMFLWEHGSKNFLLIAIPFVLSITITFFVTINFKINNQNNGNQIRRIKT